MNKLRMSLYSFMQGRYGFDYLEVFLMVLSLCLSIVSSFKFAGNSFVSLLGLLLTILVLYRCLSKNIYKRQQENYKFIQFFHPVIIRFKLLKLQAKDKQHKYFICPKCHQLIRVPKGHGKITVSCPNCHDHFDRRS